MSTVQYTIRNIPKPVDQIIRKRAKTTGKSFNQTVVDLLIAEVGYVHNKQDHSFSWLKSSLQLNAAYHEALADQSRIEEDMWK